MTWRDRLTDPWYILPIAVLAGAVLALSLAIVLEPDEDFMPEPDAPTPTATLANPTPP